MFCWMVVVVCNNLFFFRMLGKLQKLNSLLNLPVEIKDAEMVNVFFSGRSNDKILQHPS